MRKTLGLVLVVLAVLSSAVPANAQSSAQAICWGCLPGDILGDIYYISRGDNVGLVTSQNVRMVRDLTGQLPRSLYGDLIPYGGYYGIRTDGGGFYPMYDRDRRPLSGRQRIERAAGIVGIPAAIGAAAGGWKGGIIGAAIGGGVALLNDSRYRGRNDNVIVTPPSQPPPQQQPVYWSHGAPVAVGTRPTAAAGSYQPVSGPAQQEGGWKIRNRTGFKVELWDGERFVILLQPGQSMFLSNPDGIRGVMLIPGNSGKIEQKDSIIKASHDFDGWDLLAPVVP